MSRGTRGADRLETSGEAPGCILVLLGCLGFWGLFRVWGFSGLFGALECDFMSFADQRLESAFVFSC